MTRIDVPSETLLVEMGNDGLNILETTMQMSDMDESAQVQCDICSKPLGKMKDVKHIESPESITIAVWNGFKPEKMLKATENMLKEEGEENPAEIMEIVLDSWKSIVDKSETPWALCEECYESIQIYINKGGS
ncbi:MAG: hypothetical protein OI860_00070 (plasmid) [Candidatus Methanoperedens sp.]|uniref:hypothetical protein n=1 Tax=Candidatus Methanoperedens sp. BLZ2 TaxID=2035255 RepID=UPI000BE23580|nr:hypothetical protein [Candidatus Methanoperedens sp. BLZ2]KAB2946408.1 MAG: hypothetical protein F9K14_07435 [Candidatus Methanoperedens sp.]MBZ0175644.1 hypothetical protein [Candidatus Methanoperedens nitroreducens]WAH95086.1 MAG: hypothetical protein OI863_00395 [Candidatus Methanoperedens sp.]WAM22192.1 MAG: hypothetical protein OI860_00070 [Candidatus Methanoperedens sp.]